MHKTIDNTIERLILLKDGGYEPKKVLDIGANIGQFYKLFKSIYNNSDILSIDGNPNCEELLREVNPNYRIMLLGSKEEKNNFFINKENSICTGASMYKENTEYYDNCDVIELNTHTLDSLNEEFDFIKIDVQGAELDILNGGNKTISKSKYILIELSVDEYNVGSPSMDEIILYLSNLGFKVSDIFSYFYYNNVLKQVDILFENKKTNKKYWTIDKNGNQQLRDLEEEDKYFSWEDFWLGKLDPYNYMYKEMFNHFIHDDIGCDYERYGCIIQPNDFVLDIGANIGLFANRALQRGAGRVICFEPMGPTFNCLQKNVDNRVTTYKNAVGGKSGYETFIIHTDFTNTGGSTTHNQDLASSNKIIVHEEKVLKVDINDIFDLYEKNINFMKIDIEGGEVEVLTNITDENLQSLRCLSAEFHKTYDEFENFQNNFWDRMMSLGFKGFVLYHGSENGLLRTLNFWKE